MGAVENDTIATPLPGATVTAVGAAGATLKMIGRMKSFSSWPRIWQCQTYSWPKLVITLVTVTGLPSGSMSAKPIGESGAMVGSRYRTLSGTVNGTVDALGRRATIASSPGFTRKVSFQPVSLASGGRMVMPSAAMRLINCTLKR